MKDVTTFVLAGGKSSRMGQDKAFLEFEGRTLLQRALALARLVAPEVCIVGDAQKFSSFGSVVEDIFRDHGPLGGIHAALKASHTDLNLMLAVDLPFMEARFLQHLITQARADSALATVPRSSDGWQPLCAIYRRGFANLAEKSLRDGVNKIDPLFAVAQTRVVDKSELLQHGFSNEMFRNLNTPEEWQAAQKKQP
jgi:molybdenum cofactor guanylyltransferase